MPAGTAGRPDKALGGDRQAQFLMLNYFFAQQSPEQQEPSSQQLAPGVQQEDVQHLTLGLQQESALIATADKDERPRTRTARNLSFMEISSLVLKRVDACACSAGRAIRHTERSRCEGRL